MSSPQPPFPNQPGPKPSTATTQTIPAVPAMPAGPPAKAPKSRGGLLVVTLVVAVFALVVAAAGVFVSALALGKSDDALTTANAAKNQVPPTAAPTATAPTPGPTAGPTDEPTTDAPTTDPTATPTDISPTAQFEVAYEGEKLRIRSPGCNTGYRTYVDLDDPRVAVDEEDAEFTYNDCNPGAIQTELKFAQVAGANSTPADCLETIRTDPARSPTAPERGMTLCFVTSQNTAAAQGKSQKLVFVTVDSISTDNGTGILNVTAKAWNVPQ
jgi:hypothetical protein